MARRYAWFDTPDGQDILKKTNFATKGAIMVATPLASIDIFLNPQPHFKTSLFRFGALVAPVAGTAAVFSVTSQVLCREVPQMDQRYSYMIAGAVSGSVVGAAARSMYAGSIVGFYLGIIAFFGRDCCNWNHVVPTFIGNLPKTLNNDDAFLASDFRNAPPMSLPPPKARPTIPGSDFFSWMQ